MLYCTECVTTCHTSDEGEEAMKVLITGASGGIGSACARAFAKAGYELLLHYNRGEEQIRKLEKELPGCTVLQADLSVPEEVAALAEKCADADVLVNNAAVDVFGLFDLVPEEDVKKIYQVNLLAPIELSRKLVKGMLSKGSGSIINISSMFGESGGSCEVDYSATKAGLIGFTKALAKEVGTAGVRVNCVCPGVIETAMNDRLTVDEAEALCEDIALDRFGTPEEVAEAVLFLAGDKAGYITGAVLDVNGGI